MKRKKHQEERQGRILMKIEHNGVSGHRETVEVCHMLETLSDGTPEGREQEIGG